MYQLKTTHPPFISVDGEFAGKKFEHGKSYPVVPKADKAKFIKAKIENKSSTKKHEVKNNA